MFIISQQNSNVKHFAESGVLFVCPKNERMIIMAKMYTLDSKLLTGTPEIRIGDKIYPVDDRQKTVRKILDICEKNAKNDDNKDLDMIDEVFKLAFAPKDLEEIEKMNISWAAWQELFTIVISAVTGQEQEDIEARFPQENAE